jgi:methylmalonyl-CoA mutase
MLPRAHRTIEKIRERTARHASITGRYPKVLLLKRGDLKMRMARANFAFNFLGCAGFDIVEAEAYEGTGADLIVLCSSDPEYLTLAQEVCGRVGVPVRVAGSLKEQLDALKEAGVQGLLNIMSDAVATLTSGRPGWGWRNSR